MIVMDVDNETIVSDTTMRHIRVLNTKLRFFFTKIPLRVERLQYLGNEEIQRTVVDDLILDFASIQDYGATVKIFTTSIEDGKNVGDSLVMNKQLRELFVNDTVTRVEIFGHSQRTIFSDWNVSQFQLSFTENEALVSYRVVGDDVVNPRMFDDSFFGEEHKKLRDLKRSI